MLTKICFLICLNKVERLYCT